ncbi:transcription factor WhiB [Streptomyces sp. NPDC020490]|uniref:transcription factor WhiB n=1 Tax=Streptomyces sp. NPDC020490 TaxID=3365078 RepID=UPI0037A835D6
MTGWLGGLHIRRTAGGLAVADVLCAVCLHHRRAIGDQPVRDLVASDPITTHRAECPGPRKDTTP